MKLGILADSHGQLHHVRRAVEMLTTRGATAFAHCGDLGDVEVLAEFAGCPCWFVWGNTDFPDPTWQRYVQDLGLAWPTGPTEFTLAGKRLAIFHGHEPAFPPALKTPRYDYLLHGHTHKRNDYHVGSMRVINPGALHRTPFKSAALLDLATDELKYLTINGAAG